MNKHGQMPEPIVLIVSALIPYKRVDLGIRILRVLEKGTLMIYGSGILKEKLEKYANNIIGKNINKKIIFESAVYESMPFVYKLADVFLHTADENEAFGSVIIEAMASGLPVIVNDDPIRRYIVKNEFYVNNMRDTYSVAKKILIMSKAKNNFSPISKQIALEYDWKKIWAQYYNFLLKLK
ncbi:MAG: glycosyltransferase [bacterium]